MIIVFWFGLVAIIFQCAKEYLLDRMVASVGYRLLRQCHLQVDVVGFIVLLYYCGHRLSMETVQQRPFL